MLNTEKLDSVLSLLKPHEAHAEVQNLTKTLKALLRKQQILHSTPKNEKTHNFLTSHLTSYLETAETDLKSRTRMKQQSLNKLTVLESKLQFVHEMMEIAYRVPEDDLCCLDKSSDRWSRILASLTYVQSKDPEKLKKQYKEFIQLISLTQAVISTGLQESTTFERNLMVGLSAMYYFFNKKKANEQKNLSYAKCDPRVAKTAWNLMDSWICTKALNIVLNNVEEHTVIYIPRTAPHVLTDAVSEGPVNYSLTPIEGYIPVRLLHSSPLLFQSEEKKSDMCCGTREKQAKRPTSVIFHIHGGGFISMSSNSHQTYTRKWVEDLNIPVFSVDYRLAPKNPFPDGLDDVWQAYYWLVHNFGLLNMKLKKIFVNGDSAGGNLSMGVAFKAILSGIKKPDGLVLVYPAVFLDDKVFKNSIVLSLEDDILPHSFLKLCKELYVQDSSLDCSRNFWISPLVADEELIRQLPPVRVVFGENDPFLDYVFWFIERLLNNGVDVKGSLFQGTPHGALNFYMTGGVAKAKKFYQSTLQYFRELIN